MAAQGSQQLGEKNRSRMKIVQLVTQMEAAGAQKVAHVLSDGLRALGHDCELWFLYKKRPAYDGMPHVRVIFEKRPGPFSLASVPGRILRALRKARPDALITHTHYANVICQPLARMAGIPVRIAVQHNPASTFPGIARRLDAALGETSNYRAIVCVSEHTKDSFDSYAKKYRRKLALITNGVANLPVISGYDVRQKWGVPERSKLLVAVGRLSVQKNHHVLIQAMTSLPDTFLLLVGEGELRESLRSQARNLGIEGRIRFTGELSPGEVGTILQSSDLFVFPSLFEAMGLAAVEAMHAALPIVGSNIPALREALGDALEPFDPARPEDLCRAIRLILDDPLRAEQKRQAGRMQCERFSTDTMVAKYEALVKQPLDA
jgi:glycosyltransferase involved in cell wall biosynthesis